MDHTKMNISLTLLQFYGGKKMVERKNLKNVMKAQK